MSLFHIHIQASILFNVYHHHKQSFRLKTNINAFDKDLDH